MNKKNYLIAAMALPLFMAACSSEDVLTEVQDNGQYPGIAQVNASFNVENGTDSRLATRWGLEDGDIVGLAWLGDDDKIEIDGNAYQNHPLYSANEMLQPKTSIYVGKYFSYTPYDYTTKGVGEICFSIAKQPLKHVVERDISAAAAQSIWISPKWTEVTLNGWKDNNQNVFDDAGVGKIFKMYPRKFSNIVQLVLTYDHNELPNAATPDIKGIEVSYGEENAEESVVSFTYAPKTEVTNDAEVSQTFWDQYTLNETKPVAGLTAETGVIELQGKYLAEGAGNTFVYNALPANTNVTADTKVRLVLTTTYGVVTIEKPLKEIAKSYDPAEEKNDHYRDLFDGAKDDKNNEGVKPEESFVSVLNKSGKLFAKVDFLAAVMDGMHVENDAELQKMLNYYNNHKKDKEKYSEAKTNATDIKLFLDGSGDEMSFELSKESIALIQELNKDCEEGDLNVSIQPCLSTDDESCVKIIITGGGEVPALDKVFEVDPKRKSATVWLGAGSWTWANTPVAANGNLNDSNTGKNFGKVTGPINVEGDATLTLSNNNIKAVGEDFKGFENFGKIVVDAVANIKFDVINYNNSKIEIKKGAEMLAYGATITNNSYDYKTANSIVANVLNGEIINNGVLGVVKGTDGAINNYGYIKNNEGARTYITTNQTSGASFADPYAEGTNQIGTIELTGMFDNVSVSNATTQGFIKYTWTGDAVYSTPEPEVDVKYNYLIVEDNIEFTEFEPEVKYLEVAAGSNIVITAVNVFNNNHRLSGLILGKGATADIKKGNSVFADAAYINEGKLYVGGEFWYRSDLTTYLGGATTNTDNIVEY